ncbi:MAG: trimethylamine methyltransferase family protein [Desulfotignum sp.]|nr:trimethylamine methyltransferase family protein [Desulfotignum sp.]
MKLTIKYLSDKEISLLHEAALKILHDVGMRFPSPKALALFEKAGATIRDSNVVCLGENLVRNALKSTRKRRDMRLYALDPERDVTFERHDPGLACMTMATSVIDPWSGEKRSAAMADLVRLVHLSDQLECIHVSGGPVTPQDVDHRVCDWYTWAGCLKYTTKHITGGVLGEQGVLDAIDMAAVVAGSRDAFLNRPFISGWVLTLPPLGMDVESLEAMMAMNQNQIPIMLSSGPILGSTAPVTIPGMVAQAHAEILACITLSQLVSPGAPVVYTSFARGMNMQTANISMAGPEFAVLKVAMAQMGLWLDLPVRMPSMLRDAKILDAQAGFETGLVGTLTSLKADLMDAMQLDTDMVVDYADMVFCNDCMAFIRHAMRDIPVNADTLALDAIAQAGPGGNLLASSHTFSRFKTELWHSDLFDHDNWDKWEKKGARSIREKALIKTRALLEKDPQMVVTDKQASAIDKIVERSLQQQKAQ